MKDLLKRLKTLKFYDRGIDIKNFLDLIIKFYIFSVQI